MWTLLFVLSACVPVEGDDSASGVDSTAPEDTADTRDTTTTPVDCPEGEIADRGECVPAACGRGDWGDRVDGPDVAWVDAAAAEGGDGTQAAPVRTITEGLATRKSRVYVAAGAYVENVAVGGGVELAGRCSALVSLAADEDAVGIEVLGEAVVSGLTVVGAPEVGIAVRDESALTLREVVITDGVGVGILVDGRDASLIAEDFTVANTSMDPERGGGIGVSVQSGALVTLRRATIDGNQQRGVYVRGYPSLAVLESVTISGTRPYPYVFDGTEFENGGYGHGLSAESGGAVTGEEVTLLDNTEAGVWAAGEASEVNLISSTVTGTLRSERWGQGMGIVAFDEGLVEFSGNVLGSGGPAVVAQDAGRVEVKAGSALRDSEYAAFVVQDGAASLIGVDVQTVTPDPDGDGGYLGFVHGESSVAALTLTEGEGSGTVEGLYLTGPVLVELEDSTLSGPGSGYGVYASGQRTLSDGTSGIHLAGNTVTTWQVGVLLDDATATVEGSTFGDNEVDVVQTHCDDAEGLAGDGDLGNRELCTGRAWGVTRPRWIMLE